jgi:hypothetical protein
MPKGNCNEIYEGGLVAINYSNCYHVRFIFLDLDILNKMKKKSEWNPNRARRYLLKLAEDLIEDGVFAGEGGRLMHEAKYAKASETHHNFVEVIQRILEWDADSIVEALNEVYISRF